MPGIFPTPSKNVPRAAASKIAKPWKSNRGPTNQLWYAHNSLLLLQQQLETHSFSGTASLYYWAFLALQEFV
jgi:hypothetical protein